MVKLMLDTDAAALLVDLAGGPRKQGEYVSKLIRLAATGQLDRLEVLEKIADLERQLAELRTRVLQQG